MMFYAESNRNIHENYTPNLKWRNQEFRWKGSNRRTHGFFGTAFSLLGQL